MDAVDGRAPEDTDEAQRREAIRSAASRLRQLMARVPWAVVSPQWLEGIQAAYDPVIAAMESYASGEQDVAFLTTWAEIDRMWASLTPLIAAGIPEESVSEDAATFRRSTGQMTRRLSEQVEGIEARIGELRAELETVSAERDRVLAEVKEQQATLQSTIQEQSGRLDTAIAKYESQFTEEQGKKDEAFQAALSQHETDLKTYFAGWQTQATEIVEGAEERANELLANIQELETKATESYNTIGTASVAGYYQKDANDEQKQARLWRGLAAGALAFVAVGAIVELALSGGSLGWEETRSRLPVIIGLFGFSAFAVAEARGHRRAEREARDREMKLSSIDPYLVLVADDGAARQVKVDFARSLFVDSPPAGNGEDGGEDKPGDDSNSD